MKEYTITVKEDDDGSILHFDERNYCIYEKHPILGEFYWDYDKNGNLIYEKLPGDDYAWECKYDKNGRRTYVKNTDGKEYFYINDEEVTKGEYKRKKKC